MHAFSAIALGLIGVGVLYELDKNTVIKANPLVLLFFAFCFAIAIGAIWEIFEYNVDLFLGTNMQKSGLVDTMEDLMINSFGALIACIFGYFYIKKENLKR